VKNLYNAIFHRRSMRKYDMTPLTEDTLSDIKRFAENAKPLYPNIKISFSYLTSGKVKNLLPIKAPHYICLYSEKAENHLLNAGFILQQIDLYLSSIGIGSCWLGMAKPTRKLPAHIQNMDFIIMLAFGNTTGLIHRNNEFEFIRKNIDQISTIKSAHDLLNAVRLAPSSINSQPWFFSGDKENIVISRVKLGSIKTFIYEKLNQVDMGIAMCHLYIAAKMNGKNVKFFYAENDTLEVPKGNKYVMSAKLNLV